VNTRPATIAAVAAILVVGFAIGGWLAFVTRPSQQTTTTVTAMTARTPNALHTARPIAAATEAPTPKPAEARAQTAKPAATAVPTPAPAATAVPTPVPTPTIATTPPTTTSPAVAAQTVSAGSWEIDEANTQVGTIVWTADVASTSGHTVVLNAHKQSVGGRPAVPCERQTTLHAEFAATTAAQSVPYREVNCEGVATSGEMRLSGTPSADGSFSGTFWRGGVKLGDFSARRR
jgi:hypothetical protein